jgi:glycosyltransferase involved in cell wall biosynthesis
MSILVVSTNVGRSPADATLSFVFDEVMRLAKRRIDVHVARLKFEDDLRAYGVTFHDMRKINILALPSTINRLIFYPLKAFPRNPSVLCSEMLYSFHISNLLKSIKPALLHAHFAYIEGWAGYLARASLRRKIPFLVTLHGVDILAEPAVGYGVRLNKRYDAVVRKVLREADSIIVASHAVFNETVKLVDGPEKIHLIPNGVDLARFNPSLDGSAIRKLYGIEDKKIVFTLRAQYPRYGVSYLVLAAKLVLSSLRDVVFIIGGEGPLKRYNKELARRLGISSNVIFTGRIPQEVVPLYYAASDIVVVPSLQEAWGLVATEAMGCGKPVIASKVGGLPDQVIDGFNGFLVPPRNTRALADRILYLLENPSEARRMGLNGRRLAEERFDIEKRIDKIIELYKKLLNN